MNNFRNVNNDILKDWFLFREDEIASLTCEEDKRHWIYFDEISERILRNVPDKNKKYVQKQLNFLDDRVCKIKCVMSKFDREITM